MSITQRIRASRPRLAVACLASLALAACTSAGPPASVSSSIGPGPSASQVSTSQAPASQAASASVAPPSQAPSASYAGTARCALTPDALPSASVYWNFHGQGTATIQAGQAVVFTTTDEQGTTVTEGTNGIAAADACIDAPLASGSGLVVTFYQPGDYNLFCRIASTMHTVIHVK